MVKQAVKVVIRTRPTPNFATKNIQIDPINSHVQVHIPKDAHGGFINNQQETWKFKFDKIMHNSSQEDVFTYCAESICKSVVSGYNGTVMCYGQTGAGKTFTMNGATPNFKYRGIIPRSINQVFQEIGSHYDNEYKIQISYLEIYNEQMFDLLSDEPRDPSGGSAISIQDDHKGEVHVKGLSMHTVKNEEEALNLLFEGETKKTFASTQMNENSSRAHCVYTIHVQCKSRMQSAEKVIQSKLHLVDLAGNERTKKLEAAARMKEANYINKSLSFLEQVVVAACDHKKDHVPYRQSKLTNLLKSSIGGNCQTVMIANIWPEEINLEETISTLKFASRMMKVQNEATVNELQEPSLLLKKYQRQVRELRQELQMHDTVASRGNIQYDPYTPEQQYEIQLVAQQYLKGDLEEITEFSSMRQVNELLAQMRNCFRKLEQDGKNILDQEALLTNNGDKDSKDGIDRAGSLRDTDGVGEIQDQGEFGLGRAPRDSRPVNKIELTKEKEAEIADAQHFEEYPKSEKSQSPEEEMNFQGSSRNKNKGAKRPYVNKQEAFMEFKSTPEGQDLEASIRDNRGELKKIKIQVRDLTEQCNLAKKAIDAVKVDLDKKQDERKNQVSNQLANADEDEMLVDDDGAPHEIIDEEELALLQKMRELKKNYRASYQSLKAVKSQLAQVSSSIDHSKQSLVSQFEEWYEDTFDLIDQTA